MSRWFLYLQSYKVKLCTLPDVPHILYVIYSTIYIFCLTHVVQHDHLPPVCVTSVTAPPSGSETNLQLRTVP